MLLRHLIVLIINARNNRRPSCKAAINHRARTNILRHPVHEQHGAAFDRSDQNNQISRAASVFPEGVGHALIKHTNKSASLYNVQTSGRGNLKRCTPSKLVSDISNAKTTRLKKQMVEPNGIEPMTS